MTPDIDNMTTLRALLPTREEIEKMVRDIERATWLPADTRAEMLREIGRVAG